MPDSNGLQPKNLEEAVAQGFTRLMSKKVGIICAAMWVISQLIDPVVKADDPIVRYCLVGLAGIIAVLAAYAFHGQNRLDIKELEIVGRDLPDNGNGDVVQPSGSTTETKSAQVTP